MNGALQVCINRDPGMTLTYFMARSAEVAYCISKVSVYRTIGSLVFIYYLLFCDTTLIEGKSR